jgi:hypothetical protein
VPTPKTVMARLVPLPFPVMARLDRATRSGTLRWGEHRKLLVLTSGFSKGVLFSRPVGLNQRQ